MPVGPENEMRALRRAGQRAMLFGLDPATELLRDVKPFRLGVEKHIPARPVLSKLNGVPAVRGLEARETDLFPELFAVKEPLEGFVQPVGEHLYGGLRDVLAAATLETVREIISAKELVGLVVMTFDHLKHFVVNTAAFRQARKELIALSAVGVKSVLEGLVHSLCCTGVRDSAQRPFTGRRQSDGLWPNFL